MNLNNYTVKAQEVVQHAVYLTQQKNQQAIEPAHLYLALTEKAKDVSDFIFTKTGVSKVVVDKVVGKIVESYPEVTGAEPYLSKQAAKVLHNAESASKNNKDEYVSVEFIMLGLMSANDEVSKALKDAGLSSDAVLKVINELRKGEKVNNQSAEDTYNSLKKFAVNLNEQARNGKLDPVIGRDEEIRRILQILSRRTKNNPILIGEPGVGKTAIAEGLAHRIISGDIPENLKSKEVYSLDMGALIAGAKYKGEFEERLKAVVKEVIKSDGEIVLFIDEIHTLVGAGKSEGAMDAANILKPALARGELRAIGATTLDEYQKYFEKDKALERRFQAVMVDEPDNISAVSILRGLKERYENHHKVRIKDEAIIAAVELSTRYIADRFLPDKAIDLIDEAASKMRIEMNSVPQELDNIERTIKQLEIERAAIKRDNDKSKLSELASKLANLNEMRAELRANWKAEKDLIDKIQLNKSQIEQFKFEAEKAERAGDYGLVAEIRYGRIQAAEEEITQLKEQLSQKQKNQSLIKEEVEAEDIAEIVSKWTGIPVSKMMSGERDKLLRLEDELHKRVVGQDAAIEAVADAVRRNRAGLQDADRPIGSFIFLGTTGVGKTELAKALAEVLFNDENQMTRIDMSEYQERHSVSRLIGAPPGYIGYEEGGQLSEAVRRKPYSVVLLDEIEKAHPDVFNILLQVLDDGRLTDNKGRTVNFKNTIIIMTSNVGSHLILNKMSEMREMDMGSRYTEIEHEVMGLLKQTFRPEFLNRIDETILFTPLSQGQVADIIRLQLRDLSSNLEKKGFIIYTDDSVVQYLAERSYEPQFGARPIKRAVQKEVLNSLSKELITGKINKDTPIEIYVDSNGIAFRERNITSIAS